MRTADIVVAAGIGIMTVLLTSGMHHILTPRPVTGQQTVVSQSPREPFP
jgi:hypothetical protein